MTHSALCESIDDLRKRISNVRLAPLDLTSNYESILFDFDGQPAHGTLIGRNSDLVVGFGKDKDIAIAIRVMLDGHWSLTDQK